MPWILLVDDDLALREVLAEVLSEDGFTVTTHGDGLSALDACSHALPDLVLLDLQMPDMGGLEFLHWLRNLPGGEAVPVIAVTGSTRWADLDALGQQGVLHFLQKPFDLHALLALVRSVALLSGTVASAQEA